MNAVQLALTAWGYARAILVGVHLGAGYEGYQSAWRPLRNSEMGARIRAFGGYTERLFGSPDNGFLAGG